MGLELHKDMASKKQDEKREYPKIKGFVGMLPKGNKVDERVSIALDNVMHRVQFQDELNFWRHYMRIPEDGCRPETNLNEHSHNLTNIPDENMNR